TTTSESWRHGNQIRIIELCSITIFNRFGFCRDVDLPRTANLHSVIGCFDQNILFFVITRIFTNTDIKTIIGSRTWEIDSDCLTLDFLQNSIFGQERLSLWSNKREEQDNFVARSWRV